MLGKGILAVIIILITACLGSQFIIWLATGLIIWRIHIYDNRYSRCNRKWKNIIYD